MRTNIEYLNSAGGARYEVRSRQKTSVFKASALLCGLDQFNQRADLVFGWSVEALIPLGLGQLAPEVTFNRKMRLPAQQGAWAREVAPLSATVGKGDLPP